MEHTSIADITWSANRLLPAFSMPQHLDIYDIRTASGEVQLSVTTMAGLINRPEPKVYLISSDDDEFWLKEVFTSLPQDASTATGEGILNELLAKYSGSIQGYIIYDPSFIDSINIATMLAGQRNGIIVSPDLATILRQAPHSLPELIDLRKHGWSTPLQAYYWATRYLLNTSSRRIVAGVDPNATTGLRSFLVATRTFIHHLDSRQFLPDPKSGWISERGLLKKILAALEPGAVHLGWFIDEPTGVGLTSQAAIPVLASDHFFNLEVWTSIQPDLLERKKAETPPVSGTASPHPEITSPRPGSALPDILHPKTEPKVYVSFTLSEGDNLQYIQHYMSHLWRDSARGSVPIGWTISPALMEAAPSMATYYMRTATPNDELLAGPSGAGYMYPSQWPEDQLSTFLQRTGTLMQNMNLTVVQVLDVTFLQNLVTISSTSLMSLGQLGQNITGWLNSDGQRFTNNEQQQRFVEALRPYGVRGILSGSGRDDFQVKIISNVPVYQNLGLASNVSNTLSLIRNAAQKYKQRPLFLSVYVLAWKVSPSDLKQVVQELGSEYEAVTPGTLLTNVGAQ